MKSFRKILVVPFLLLGFSYGFLSYSGSDYTKTPVFFVHGYGMSAGSWNTLINYLQNNGYPSEFLRAIQLTPNDGGNVSAAKNQIAPAIETFLSDINNFLATNYPQIPQKDKVDIVSHSMGGLSSRWYTARLKPERVNKWISLAGANHGTNDLCGRGTAGADDLCPAYAESEQDSFVQYKLNGEPYVADVDETPYGIGLDLRDVSRISPEKDKKILYVTIRTTNDVWIDPDDSVILDGTGGFRIPIPGGLPATETSPGNIRMDNGIRHDPMQHDPDTMRLVKIILGIKDKLIKVEHGKKKK